MGASGSSEQTMRVLYVTDFPEHRGRIDHRQPLDFTTDYQTVIQHKLAQCADVTVVGANEMRGKNVSEFDLVIWLPAQGDYYEEGIIVAEGSSMFLLDMHDPALRHLLREHRIFRELGNASDGIIVYRQGERALIKHLFGEDKVIHAPRMITEIKALDVQRGNVGDNVMVYVGICADMGNTFPIAHIAQTVLWVQNLGHTCHLIAQPEKAEWLRRIFPSVEIHHQTSQPLFFELLSQMRAVVVPFILDSSLSPIVDCACLRVPIWCVPYTGFGEELFPGLVYCSLDEIDLYREDLPEVLEFAYQKVDMFSYEVFFGRLKSQWKLNLV